MPGTEKLPTDLLLSSETARKAMFVTTFGLAMVSCSFVLVAVRVLVRYSRMGRLGLSDAFAVLAWFNFLANAVFTVILARDIARTTPGGWGFMAKSLSTEQLKMFYVAELLYHNCSMAPTLVVRVYGLLEGSLTHLENPVYAVKGCVLCVFYEFMREINRWWLRPGLFFLCFFTAAGWLLQFLVKLLWCRPLSRQWSHEIAGPHAYCNYREFQVAVYLVNVPHFLTDFLIYLFPLPVILPLVLSYRPRKCSGQDSRRLLSIYQIISLAASFVAGFLCIAVAISQFAMGVRPYYAKNHGHSKNVYYILVALEQTYAIMVVCAPATMVAVGSAFRTMRAMVVKEDIVEPSDVEIGSRRRTAAIEGPVHGSLSKISSGFGYPRRTESS